jgi:hypothetical protein
VSSARRLVWLSWVLSSLAVAAACATTSTLPATPDAAPPTDGTPAPDGPNPPWSDSMFPFDVAPPSAPCNGDPAYCARAYNEMTFAVTHAAMSAPAPDAAPSLACATQDLSIGAQLGGGIRALHLEAHVAGGGDGGEGGDSGASVELCLGDCGAGEVPIASALDALRAFLAVNPREVVTLLIDGAIDAAPLASAIMAAGLDAFALARSPEDPWPTLGAMVASSTRLVVLADVTGTPPAWLLPMATYVAATGTGFTSTAAMTCGIAQGAPGAPLFLVNQYLVSGEAGAPCGGMALAQAANAEPFLTNRVMECATEHGAQPTFIVVDFFDQGDVLGVARAESAL